jgi:hypothetical protein
MISLLSLSPSSLSLPPLFLSLLSFSPSSLSLLLSFSHYLTLIQSKISQLQNAINSLEISKKELENVPEEKPVDLSEQEEGVKVG